MKPQMNPLGAKYGEKIIEGVKQDLRGVLNSLRTSALADGYPPGTVPLKQTKSPLIAPFE